MKNVLIMDDEKSIRDLLVINFKRAGYTVHEADCGRAALKVFEENPDIILAILDIMLPDIDGFQVCRRLREKNRNMGIIMLSAKDLDEDMLSGYGSGADDYVKKPFSPAILIAKADALCRRVESVASSSRGQTEAPKKSSAIYSYEGSPFSRDTRTNSFYKNGKPLDLTPTEVNILKFFLEHPDTPLTREEILQGVWGEDFYGDPDIVNVNIRRLRVKIEESAKAPKYIKTEWNYGYRWSNGEE